MKVDGFTLAQLVMNLTGSDEDVVVRRNSPGTLTALVVVLLAATAFVVWLIVTNDRHDRQAHDRTNVGALRSAVASLADRSTTRLIDMAAAMETTDRTTRRRSFTNLSRLMLDDPALSTIAYVQIVNDRATYELERHRIIGVDGESAPRADSHYVIDQRFAKDKGRQALGVDLRTDAVRRSNIDKAIASGGPLASPPLTLLSGVRGTTLYVPVYRAGMPIETVAQRRRAAIGLISASMRVDRLGRAVRRLTPQLDAFIVTDRGRVVTRHGDVSGETLARTLSRSGRTWIVAIPRTATNVLWSVVAVLLAAAALIAFIVVSFTQARRRERYANRMVERRTSELHRANHELSVERHQMAMAQRIARLGSWTMDASRRNARWSDEVYALMGADRDDPDFSPDDWEELVRDEDRGTVSAELERAGLDGGEFGFEFERALPDAQGRPVTLAVHGFVERDDEGAPVRLIGTIIDVSERRRSERRLRHEADHDPLTGLANRRSFERSLGGHLADKRRKGAGAVLMIDLDGLKEVNDAHGHAAGDSLITGTAERLSSRLREDDVCARIGGDEFAVLLPDADRATALRVADDLLGELHRGTARLRAIGVESIAASIGVAAIVELDEPTTERLLVLADEAMYAVKQAGGDAVAAGPAAADLRR